MVKKMLTERKPTVRIEWEIEFGDPNSFERPCYAFPCEPDGNPKPFVCKEAEENYNRVMELAKTDAYFEPRIIKQEIRYVENATAICECGTEIELWDQYLAACQCDKCGRWHNLFGQTLVDPEFWEEDY